MNRRGFLKGLIAASLVAAIDPEKLLWEPGKSFSLPALEVFNPVSITVKPGMPIKFLRNYDLVNNIYVSRLDALYGVAALNIATTVDEEITSLYEEQI